MTDHSKIKAYWERDDVESMYDKYYVEAEARLILNHIPDGARVLDAGCGEGEATLQYASVPDVQICACDYSNTRLKKAAERLSGCPNVELKQVDLTGDLTELGTDYDRVVTERCLINIPTLDEQLRVVFRLMDVIKPGGKLLMLEGYQQGADELNELRASFNLDPIPARWHNKFIDNDKLVTAMAEHGYALEYEDGLGDYMMLTRGIRPTLDSQLNWDCAFNRIASGERVKSLLNLGPRFSRVKLWVFGKPRQGSGT